MFSLGLCLGSLDTVTGHASAARSETVRCPRLLLRCSASWFRSLVTTVHYRQAGSSLALGLCSIISDISCTMRGAAAGTCGLRESPPATDAVSLAATLRRGAGWPGCCPCTAQHRTFWRGILLTCSQQHNNKQPCEKSQIFLMLLNHFLLRSYDH